MQAHFVFLPETFVLALKIIKLKHAQGGEAGGVRAEGLHEIAAVPVPEAHQTQRFAKGSLVVVIDVEFPGRPLL